MEAIKLTGLWKHKKKDGQTYLSGALSGITQISVLPNSYKRNDRDPDYFLYIREAKKRDDTETQTPQDDDL